MVQIEMRSDFALHRLRIEFFQKTERDAAKNLLKRLAEGKVLGLAR